MRGRDPRGKRRPEVRGMVMDRGVQREVDEAVVDAMTQAGTGESMPPRPETAGRLTPPGTMRTSIWGKPRW